MPLRAEIIGRNLSHYFSLQNKSAVAVGCAGGLGTSWVKALVNAGARVAVIDVEPKNLDRCLQSVGEGAEGFTASALDLSQLRAAREAIVKRIGEPEILICGTGGNVKEATVGSDRHVEDIDTEVFKRCLDLNLTSLKLSIDVFGVPMTKIGQGSIITIGSASSHIPLSKVPIYSLAKAAVVNYTKFMAREWAHFGVRVNALVPGFIITDQNRFLLTKKDTQGELTERGIDVLKHTPMKRFGEPEDLEAAIIFLASDGSRFMTGAEIVVDGGFLHMTI